MSKAKLNSDREFVGSDDQDKLIKLSVESPWLNINIEAAATELYEFLAPLLSSVISEMKKGQ